MKKISIDTLDDTRIAPYTKLKDKELQRCSPGQPLFIAESPKVILRALRAGYEPVSLLCEERRLQHDAPEIAELLPEDTPIYTGTTEMLSQLTGYPLTRGILCTFKRPEMPTIEEICRNTRGLIVVMEEICDTTNIGSIFRTSAALGAAAVLLTKDCCDPLNRRSVRVSMGTVFQVPWTWIDSIEDISRLGITTIAMALRHDALEITDPQLKAQPRRAIIMGAEGPGLKAETIRKADMVARIPMSHNVDSLNVGIAAALAIWELSDKKERQ